MKLTRRNAIGTLTPTVTGAPVHLNADGSRLAVTTTAATPTENTPFGRAVLIDTATGALVYDSGEGVYLPRISFSADGSRAAVSNMDFMLIGAQFGGRSVKFIDAVSGTQIGDQLSLASPYATVSLNSNGTKAITTVYSATVVDGAVLYDTTVRLLRVADGSSIGTPLTLSDVAISPAQFNKDGSRAVLVVYGTSDPTSYTAYRSGVIVIDTSTGAQVGTTAYIPGMPITTTGVGDGWIVNPTGTHAVLVALEADLESAGLTGANVSVINLASGAVVGAQHDFDMAVVVAPEFSADGTRVLLTGLKENGDGPTAPRPSSSTCPPDRLWSRSTAALTMRCRCS